MSEGSLPDAGDAIRNRDARQAGAVFEGRLPDAGDAIRNRDARQVGAVLEGTAPMLVTPSGMVMLVRLVQSGRRNSRCW